MASKVEIFNLAMVRMGAEGLITSPTEASNEARALEQVYDATVLELLEGTAWQFAEEYAGPLPRLTDPNPNPRHTFWFKKPARAMTMREILNGTIRPKVPIPFTMFHDATQGQVFGCDFEGPCVRYTYRMDDISEWSPGFVSTLAWLLAANVALRLTGKPAVQQGMIAGYAQALRAAQSAIDGQQFPVEDATWIQARE